MGDEKPLTWQQVLAVLCCLPLFVSIVVAIIPNATRTAVIGGWAVAVLFSVLFILLLISHWRRIHRRDLFPDILIQLFEPRLILQVGAAHFFISAKQRKLAVRVVVVVQNVRDGNGRFSLGIRAAGQAALGLSAVSSLLSAPVPTVDIDLAPASVTLLQLDVPLNPIDHPTTMRLWLTPAASGSGKQVRFSQREAVKQRVSPWITLAGLLVGRFHYGGGTYIDLVCNPVSEPIEPLIQNDPDWQAPVLWTPENPLPIEEIHSVVSSALGDTA